MLYFLARPLIPFLSRTLSLSLSLYQSPALCRCPNLFLSEYYALSNSLVFQVETDSCLIDASLSVATDYLRMYPEGGATADRKYIDLSERIICFHVLVGDKGLLAGFA